MTRSSRAASRSELRAWAGRHSLSLALVVTSVVLLAAGTWATWTEFATNEGLGMEGQAVFWSREFFAYWSMQLAMNLVPELLGALFLVLATKKLYEIGSSHG